MPQVASLTIVKASELGCILDCNLLTGLNFSGGAATDNTARINAFLATASASNPIHLLIDGGSLISGVQISPSGHTIIEGKGWDTGFYVKSGSNADAINNVGAKNQTPFAPGPPAPSKTSQNITVRNLFINGNRGNGTTGNSNSGFPQGANLGGGPWYIGINIINASHVLIDHVWCYDIATYGVRCSNVSDVIVQNCRIESPTLSINTDGTHFDGSCSNIRISNCYFSVGDDSIALNAPEGYSGNISSVLVDNCDFQNGYSMMRIYSSATGAANIIDKVVVSNCIANLFTLAFQMGAQNGAGVANSIGSFKVSNCIITAPLLALVTNNTGLFELSNIHINLTSGANGIQVSQATVATLKICGLSVTGGTVPYLVDVPAGAALTALLLDAVDPRNISAIVSAAGYTQITSVGGSGLKAIGLEIPNSVMLNGCDFLSATSHLPSIKIAGTVKTYTVT